MYNKSYYKKRNITWSNDFIVFINQERYFKTFKKENKFLVS